VCVNQVEVTASEVDVRAINGVADCVDTEAAVFRRIAPPRPAEPQAHVERLAERIGRALQRQGISVAVPVALIRGLAHRRE